VHEGLPRGTTGEQERRFPVLSQITLSIYKKERPRPTTYHELFFDLVFVAAVSSLGTLLKANHSPTGVVAFVALLAAVWWAWISFSYFADLFGDEGVLNRAALVIAMLGACVIAVTVRDIRHDSGRFAATFALLFLMLGGLYLLAYLSLHDFPGFFHCYLTGSLANSALWFTSLAVVPPARYYLWVLGVGVNMILSGPLAYLKGRTYPRQISHMPERFASFTLIVLGESILAVVIGLNPALRGSSAATAVAGFVIAAAIWSVYSSRYDADTITRALQQEGWANVKTFIYGYGHLILYAAVLATGVAVTLEIKGGHAIPLLGIAIAGVITGFAIIWFPFRPRAPLKLIVGMLAVAIGAVIVSLGWVGAAYAVIAIAVGWTGLAFLARRPRPVDRRTR
jgi:low temperature requirement protein LtrA